MVKKIKKPTNKNNNRTLNILTHVLSIFLSFLAPLIILVATDNKTTKQHAKAALNWQISLVIYQVIAGVLMFILIGFVILPILSLLNVIFCILASIDASENKIYKYPMTIPFFKI